MKPNALSLPPLLPPLLSIRTGKKFAFLPDGERMVAAGAEKAWMVSLATGQPLLEFVKPAPFVRGVAVSSDGHVVAIAAQRDRVILYDADTGSKTHSLKVGNDGELSGLQFAPGSHTLLHSSWHGLTVIDPDSSPVVRPLRVSAAFPENTMYHGIAFSPSGERFASVWSRHWLDGNVSLCNWPSGEETDLLPCAAQRHSYLFSHALFSPDNRALLLNLPDGSVVFWDLIGTTQTGSSRTWIAQTDVGPGGGSAGDRYSGCLEFSPDGTLLAYGQEGMLGLWAWRSGDCLGRWSVPGRNPMVKQIGFFPSGNELVVSFWDAPRGIFVYRVADLIQKN